jgi:hypothetical protein
MIVGEALIEIDMADFWEFVRKHHPDLGETLYGVPRVNKSNGTLEIDVAFSESCSPKDWAVKSKAESQWEDLK